MARLTYRGSWRISVVHKMSDWPQRIVISGSINGVIPGQVGVSVLVAGDCWQLAVEHHRGDEWRANRHVAPGLLKHKGGRAAQVITSKDQYWPGDSAPNDLVLRMDNVGAPFEVVGQHAVDARLRPLPGGALAGRAAEYLAVEVRNTGYQAFDFDTVLDISDAGRGALAEHGVLVQEGWSSTALRATGQEAFGRAVALPPVEVGERATAYFPIDASLSRAGTPEVEFVLLTGGDEGGPTPARRRGVHPVPVGDAGSNRPVTPPDLELVRGLEMLRTRAGRDAATPDGRARLLDVAAKAATREDKQVRPTHVEGVERGLAR